MRVSDDRGSKSMRSSRVASRLCTRLSLILATDRDWALIMTAFLSSYVGKLKEFIGRWTSESLRTIDSCVFTQMSSDRIAFCRARLWSWCTCELDFFHWSSDPCNADEICETSWITDLNSFRIPPSINGSHFRVSFFRASRSLTEIMSFVPLLFMQGHDASLVRFVVEIVHPIISSRTSIVHIYHDKEETIVRGFRSTLIYRCLWCPWISVFCFSYTGSITLQASVVCSTSLPRVRPSTSWTASVLMIFHEFLTSGSRSNSKLKRIHIDLDERSIAFVSDQLIICFQTVSHDNKYVFVSAIVHG